MTPTSTSPPIQQRSAFVDQSGILTQYGYWVLYNLFKDSTQSQGTLLLEAFDSGTEAALSLIPRVEDLERLFALSSESIQSAPTPVSGGSVTVDRHTIGGATTIHASLMPAPDNWLLVVALTFTVSAQPVFSAIDFSIPPGALSTLVGTRSNILFCADGSGKWMMVAPPMTRRS